MGFILRGRDGHRLSSAQEVQTNPVHRSSKFFVEANTNTFACIYYGFSILHISWLRPGLLGLSGGIGAGPRGRLPAAHFVGLVAAELKSMHEQLGPGRIGRRGFLHQWRHRDLILVPVPLREDARRGDGALAQGARRAYGTYLCF